MPLQGAVDATVVFKEETTFGTPAGAASAQLMRRVSSNLALKKGSFTSNEVRSDQQISDMRHGGRSVAGAVESELALVAGGVTYEPLLAALLRGTWAAGATASPAEFATGVTVTASGQTTVFTFAGASSLLTRGFRAGDVVRLTGTTNAALSGKNLRVVAVTALVLTVAGLHGTQAQQAAGWTLAVQGRKLVMGVTKRSFTMEQRYADATVYERFTGCRINGASINIPPNGMATISFDIMGQDGLISAAPYFTTPAVETSGGNMSGTDGAVRIGGRDLGIVTGAQLNIQNNVSAPPVVGSVISPELFMGKMVVTGSVSVFLENVDLLQAFDQETEVDISFLVEAAGADPAEFFSFVIRRAKFSAGEKTLGPDGGVVIQLPFQGLIAGGPANDATTLSIQRSTTAA